LSELYIGLMSGTSLNGVDAALLDLEHYPPKLIATHKDKIPEPLRKNILTLCHSKSFKVNLFGKTDVELGELFAEITLALLSKTKLNASDILAIGSHGQTIGHFPDSTPPFTLQIGDPNVIAAKTRITTVADFRRRDMALGGQAAPLAPAFHHYLFQQRSKDLCVLNIGGIANITFLPNNRNKPITGFDTGPGNVLMDMWCKKNKNKSYDQEGKWALTGKPNQDLLEILLNDSYFHKSAPKSTGREYFNLKWLQSKQTSLNLSVAAEDIQATLLELTARSISSAIKKALKQPTLAYALQTIWVCGGGAYNTALMKRLNELCSCDVYSIKEQGIDPDWIEAAAFAWLAQQTLLCKPGNIPSVTGAKSPSILGAIYKGSMNI